MDNISFDDCTITVNDFSKKLESFLFVETAYILVYIYLVESKTTKDYLLNKVQRL